MSTLKPVLYNIEVENFKTYAGKVTIGPFHPFMAVIGPNGSGKSNLIDALSFALGEKASKLRVKQLSDLIHGAHVGKPIAESASVALYFKYEDATQESEDADVTVFRRVVSKTSQDFILNDRTVKNSKYMGELSALGLNIKAENFLIYQGKVETIAVMDQKQRSALFEEISGSKALKRRYEDLKLEMNNAVGSSHSVLLKHRSFRSEYQEAKQEQGEAKKYDLLLEDLNKNRVELHLFKLFYNQKVLDQLEEEKSLKEIEVEEMQTNKRDSEKKLKNAKKLFGTASRELAELETEIQVKETKLKKVQLPFIKAKEEVAHLKKKLETAHSSLKQALDVQNKHKDTLGVLKKALADVETEQQQYIESVAEESISQGRDIELEESQARDYNELKREAASLSGSLNLQVESLTREQKANLDRKENEMRRCSSIKEKITKKSQEKEECMKRCQRLSERICSNEKDLQDLLAKQKSLKSESLSCQENIASIQNELSQITAQLNDAHGDTHEMNKKNQKQQVAQKLKELFPGVYDRLKCLCEPVHKKYGVALARVMGRYMDAIVVDKEITAKRCIQYLREQMLAPEIFLPLDYLEVKELQENLRKMGRRDTYLLYDVLKYDPPSVKNAILFATKSVLVCGTPEDAMSVAFQSQKRLDAISLDGTYYQKSGLMSGGSADLLRRAKQWDDNKVAEMQAQKTELSEKLQQFLKESRCQSELKTVDCEVKGFTSRVKLMKLDLEESLSKIRLLDEELDKLNETLQACQPKLDDIDEIIERQSHELKGLEQDLHAVEDRVFANFCVRIGVRNIRAYEEGGLKAYEEREKKRMEFEDRKNRIKTQLDYEMTVDTDDNVKRWNDEIVARENALTNAKNLVENQQESVTLYTNELKVLNEKLKEKRTEVGTLEKATDLAKKDVRVIDDTIHAKQKQLLKLETDIGNLHGSRRAILIHCCVEGIKLPILEGDVKLLLPGRSDESESGSSASVSANSQATTSEIVVDYGRLSSDLKKLKGASIKDHEATLGANIAKLSAKLMSMGAMNTKAGDKLAETSERLKETNSEIEFARKQARKKIEAFEKVKKQRCDAFNDCFDFVSSEIDLIYKQLTQSSSAMALLTAENAEEPYLGGICYNCIAPGKPCKPMQSLSGGEKTIASLALVIALHRYGKAPYLILDEVDAALDNTNIANVAQFFSTNKNQFHTIAISLQPSFYCYADALVGVTVDQRDESEDPGSAVFLFDLTPYEHQKKNK